MGKGAGNQQAGTMHLHGGTGVQVVSTAAAAATKVLLLILLILCVGIVAFVGGFVGGFSYGLKTARLENAGVSAPAAAPSLAADASAAGLMFQRAAGNDKEATSLVADLLTDGRAVTSQLAGPCLSPPAPPFLCCCSLVGSSGPAAATATSAKHPYRRCSDP